MYDKIHYNIYKKKNRWGWNILSLPCVSVHFTYDISVISMAVRDKYLYQLIDEETERLWICYGFQNKRETISIKQTSSLVPKSPFSC